MNLSAPFLYFLFVLFLLGAVYKSCDIFKPFFDPLSCGLSDVALVFPELGPVHQTDSVLPGRSVLVYPELGLVHQTDGVLLGQSVL